MARRRWLGPGHALPSLRPALAIAPAPRRLRVGITALLLAIVFTASTYSSTDDDLIALASSVQAGADRLVELQRPDGTWPLRAGGEADVTKSGLPARALLAAHDLTADPRHLAAADRAAGFLVPLVATQPGKASLVNLTFLAEWAHQAGEPDVLHLVCRLRLEQLEKHGDTDPRVAGQRLASRRNPTHWPDDAWQNYLFHHAGQVAELARAVGEHGWADEFIVTVASGRTPKYDYRWWTIGAGSLLEQLSRARGPEARRLASVQAALLAHNEGRPGVPWNTTPYDERVHALETAIAIRGMSMALDESARVRAREGARFLIARQLPSGGWPGVLELDARPSLRRHATSRDPSASPAMESTSHGSEALLAIVSSWRHHGRPSIGIATLSRQPDRSGETG